jgi:acetyl esterase/lipase
VLDGVGAPIRTWPGYREWARLLIAAGINVVLYDGRTVGDAEAALAYVHSHARALALDDRRLCIFASSANAQVGARLPLRRAGTSIACAVYYYPLLDVPTVRPDLPALVVRTGIDTPQILAAVDAWVATAVAANTRRGDQPASPPPRLRRPRRQRRIPPGDPRDDRIPRAPPPRVFTLTPIWTSGIRTSLPGASPPRDTAAQVGMHS